MKEISLCMIVRDEEDVLGRCLESAKDIADEIIIVDTGSTDKTKEIASEYTDKIYDFEWVNDFAKARNYSFSKATKDYILWLDADDVIFEKDRLEFLKLKEEIDGTIDIYQMKYNYAVDKDNNPTLVQVRSRLLKRDKNYQWTSPIHEVIVPSGNIKKTDIAITHKKIEIKDVNRNLKIFEEMIRKGIEFDDRQEYSYAKELYYLKRYDEAIVQYEKYWEKNKNRYNQLKIHLYPTILELADSYKRKNEKDKQLSTLLKILEYEIPGTECCCKIGEIFLDRKEYKTAAYWYEQALNNRKGVEENGDANVDYNEFIPYISLCVCYYWLGDKEKSREYNEKAGKLKPNDETYLFNKKAIK